MRAVIDRIILTLILSVTFGVPASQADVPPDRKLFWSEANSQALSLRTYDLESKTIKRLFSIAQTPVPTATDWSRISDVAVDTGGKRLYWSRIIFHRDSVGSAISLSQIIERSTFAGRSRTAIISPSTNVDGTSILTSQHDVPACAIAIDTVNNLIYWNSIEGDAIRRSTLSGTDQTDVITGRSRIRDIALDLSTTPNKVYWVENTSDDEDSNTGSVFRADVDGTDVEEVINSSSQIFKSLALDTLSSPKKLYYTEVHSQGRPAINQYNLDGSLNSVLKARASGVVDDLLLAKPLKRLYWNEYPAAGKNAIRRLTLSTLQTTGVLNSSAAINGLSFDDADARLAAKRARAQINIVLRFLTSAVNGRRESKNRTKASINSLVTMTGLFQYEMVQTHPQMTADNARQAKTLLNAALSTSRTLPEREASADELRVLLGSMKATS